MSSKGKKEKKKKAKEWQDEDKMRAFEDLKIIMKNEGFSEEDINKAMNHPR